MSKPIVLLDIDGICANFIERALFKARMRWPGREDIRRLDHDDIKNPKMEFNLALTDAERAELVDMWRQPGFCYGIMWYPFADDYVKALRSIATVVAVTAPFPGSATWFAEREQWLIDYFGFKGSWHDVIQTHVKDLVFGHVLVEDKPSTLAAWKERWPGGTDVLWWRPYNSEHSATAVLGGPDPQRKGDNRHRWEALFEVVRAVRS
jgi:5'(3')-deoxyribonucleotidase